jgi:hypothetical protein
MTLCPASHRPQWTQEFGSTVAVADATDGALAAALELGMDSALAAEVLTEWRRRFPVDERVKDWALYAHVAAYGRHAKDAAMRLRLSRDTLTVSAWCHLGGHSVRKPIEHMSDALEEIERLRADLDMAAGMILVVLSKNMLTSNAYETQRGDSAPVIDALRDILSDWEGDYP